MKLILRILCAALALLVCAAAAAEGDCLGDHARIEVNGVSLYYEVAGEGKPVVLVSGNSGDHTNLSVMIRQLADAGYCVYALDSRGQGQNAPMNEYHYADMAEDVRQFIEALELDKPAYYGWSDGGIIGLLLSIDHPDLLSLLAVSGANIDPSGADPENAIVRRVAQMVAKNHDPLLELLFSEPQIDPASLSGIAIPVLVTAGSDDLILREHTQLIADSLPNSELAIVDGADHSSYIYESEIMGELLLDFLNRNGY